MVINQKELLKDLRAKITDFAYPLTLENVFLDDKYDDLVNFLILLTRYLKDEEYILKGIAIELMLTISSIENFQGAYPKKEIRDKAEMLEELLNNIYSGEVYGDRIPGIPRIV